jgi:predicted dehydrogenase
MGNQPSNRVSRRQFLKRAGAVAAGAIAMPAIVPASAFGQNAPSERLNIGMIGMGKMMSGHLGVFLGRPDTQILAMCDVESERLEFHKNHANETYAQQQNLTTYDGVKTYHDFRELLARDDIDAIVTATPDHWHALIAIAAAEAGKDTYGEKPLSYSIYEAQKMVEAVRRYGRVFQTGSMQRSERGFRVACELVRNGRIGKIKEVFVSVGGPPIDCNLPAEPVPAGLDWDFWLGPAPYRPYNSDIAPGREYKGWPNFRAYRDYAGGGMTDWGAHHFDIAQWGLGMDGSGPVEIIPPNGKDVKMLTYRYANGVVMYHGEGTDPQAGVEFVGEKGRVFVNRGYLRTDPEGLEKEPIGPDEIHLYESPGHQQDWINCIKTRKRPITDVEIGASSVIVCHLGNIAYRLQRPLQWDPDKQQFLNDDEATRLMARPMRGPWRV